MECREQLGVSMLLLPDLVPRTVQDLTPHVHNEEAAIAQLEKDLEAKVRARHPEPTGLLSPCP